MDFGAIDAGPTDLTRILLVEFSLVYGNDWYVVPVRLPVGSLFRVTNCTVRDTFGMTSTITRSQNSTGPRWSVFDLAGDYFFLPPTLAADRGGSPIEQVQLAPRRVGEPGLGHREDRTRRLRGPVRAGRRGVDPGGGNSSTDRRSKRLWPTGWPAPFPSSGSRSFPCRAGPGGPGTNPVIRLERRALLRPKPTVSDGGSTRRAYCCGATRGSDPDAEPPLRIAEEEVPREGAVVERTFQYARWFDGRNLLWLAGARTPVAAKGRAACASTSSPPTQSLTTSTRHVSQHVLAIDPPNPL